MRDRIWASPPSSSASSTTKLTASTTSSAALHRHDHSDAFCISGCPSKYDVCRGKMAPQATATHRGLAASPAPKRDSISQATRQRLQQDQRPPRKSWLNRSSGWRPASSVYSTADDEPPRPHFSLTAWAMQKYGAKAPVSPPSSPEPDDRHVAARDVDEAVSYLIKPHGARVRTNDSRRDQGPVRLSPAAAAVASPVAAGAVRSDGRSAPVPPPVLGSRVGSKSKKTPGGATSTTTTTEHHRRPSKNSRAFSSDLYVAPLNVRRGNQAPPSTRALISDAETGSHGAATTSSQWPPPLALKQEEATAPSPSKPLATALFSYPAAPASASFTRSPHRPRPRSRPPPCSSATSSPSSKLSAPHTLAAGAPSASAGNVNSKPGPPVNARSPSQDTSRSGGRKDPAAADAVRPPQTTPEPARVLPSSRFSVTTCATSIPDTPRQSAVPSLAARSEQSYSSSITESTSEDCNDRGTPDTAAILPASLYSTIHRAKSSSERKGDSIPRTLPPMDTQSIDCGSSILSMAKPLPPALPELSASQDRIEQLNAYIQSLAHRRINICKSIQQMTELMPVDTLFASDDVLRKREAEKRKVQALKDELADIKHEEYNAGLKLHRARKRLERDAEYEQTTATLDPTGDK